MQSVVALCQRINGQTWASQSASQEHHVQSKGVSASFMEPCPAQQLSVQLVRLQHPDQGQLSSQKLHSISMRAKSAFLFHNAASGRLSRCHVRFFRTQQALHCTSVVGMARHS